MESIKIVANGSYLPKNRIENKTLEEKFEVEENYIFKRTGIKQRFYIEDEKIEDLAIYAAKQAIEQIKEGIKIDMIIVASTTTKHLMPGISFLVQKALQIEGCMCLDILGGCNGYINALDIARTYITIGKIKTALVIGVDLLSEAMDPKDIGTSILFSDGAGATIITKTEEDKKYYSHIQSEGQNGEILTYQTDTNIYMDGKEIYKYAVTDTVKNIKEVLKQSGKKIEEIKYIVPHQSNIKIMKAIASRLKIEQDRMYTNIEKVGNTFCASIPIALQEMMEKEKIQKGDIIILLGYGGGLNTGSILMEV